MFIQMSCLRSAVTAKYEIRLQIAKLKINLRSYFIFEEKEWGALLILIFFTLLNDLRSCFLILIQNSSDIARFTS